MAELYFLEAIEDELAVEGEPLNSFSDVGCWSSRGACTEARSECDAAVAGSARAEDPALLACREYDDWAVALTGRAPELSWLTRLEFRLPRTALELDCDVEPVPSSSPLSSQRVAGRMRNPPCEPTVFASSLSARRPRGVEALLWMLAFSCFWARRRSAPQC